MLSWHVWSICKAETSVESHDHEIYRKIALERGQVAFQNSYDLGSVYCLFSSALLLNLDVENGRIWHYSSILERMDSKCLFEFIRETCVDLDVVLCTLYVYLSVSCLTPMADHGRENQVLTHMPEYGLGLNSRTTTLKTMMIIFPWIIWLKVNGPPGLFLHNLLPISLLSHH